MLCSWARHLTLSVPLFTQGYKEVPKNLMLETQRQLMAIRVYQPNRCEIFKRKRERTLCLNSNPQTSSMSINVACFSPKFSEQTEAEKPLDSWTCSVGLIAWGALSFQPNRPSWFHAQTFRPNNHCSLRGCLFHVRVETWRSKYE